VELQLGSTTSPVRTFNFCGLARLHQPALVLPIPCGTSGDQIGEIRLGKSKISLSGGMMEKQPGSCHVYGVLFVSAGRMRPPASLNS